MPATAVTKSSHYVSVQQTSSSGGATRYLSWSVGGRQHYFCSLQGLLRLLQVALLLIVVILARVGSNVRNSSGRLVFGYLDTDLTGIGASIGLLIIVLILVACHLLGHLPTTLLEVLVNLAGAVLLLTVGGLCTAHYSNRYRNDYDRTPGIALGALTIIAGVVFLVDLILSLRHLRINIST